MEQDSGTDGPLNDVAFCDAKTGYIVGARTFVLRTTNGGATWLPQTLATTNGLRGVCLIDPNTGWIVGEKGMILKTLTGGSSQ
jgi:hypothetical protein